MARFELQAKVYHNRKSCVFNDWDSRFDFQHDVARLTEVVFGNERKLRLMLCGNFTANAAVGPIAHAPLLSQHFDELSRFRKGVNVQWMLIGFAHNVQ